ncbi:hypothetical protein MPOCJGCO_3929 [Methylobacterium trifolii]|uniref:Uncharacterized protein n=1 Tax=Methylobacterium trifolii TaxID=1003092 RepID=A0ABQ4U442_9HYPH|nr:hypothetical protein MPOCJGCO_3929 [Methylobacterium trifolii]
MSDPRRALLCPPLPPIGPQALRPRVAPSQSLTRLARFGFCLAALSLPVLGITVADTVHRASGPETMQAAVLSSPSRSMAVPAGASRTAPPVREAFLHTVQPAQPE